MMTRGWPTGQAHAIVELMYELTEDAEPAVTLPRPPETPLPSILTGWDLPRRRITVRVDGRERLGRAQVVYEWPDRKAVRVTLRPLTPGAPVDDGRWWWTDRSMRWGWLPYANRDAELATPHNPRTDPASHGTHYPAPDRPELWIVIGGEWVRCRVLWKEKRGGRIAYHVERPVLDNGIPDWRHASFWWDPRYMKAVPYNGPEAGRR